MRVFSTAVPHEKIYTGEDTITEENNHHGNAYTNGKGTVAIVNSRPEDHQADMYIHCVTVSIGDEYLREGICKLREKKIYN